MAVSEVGGREVEAQIREQIVPTAESWVARAGRRFDAGETDVFVVLRARQRLAEARVTLVEAEDRLDLICRSAREPELIR
ncbi:MAG: TolC family protein [Acidobacteria bacterium]|nr:TolC family protein [Acidobacteriota bacterium]